IADDEKAWRLQARDQRLFGARSGRGDSELVALARHARRRFPARERVREFHFDDGYAVLVGDDVRLPEGRRAEIIADLYHPLLPRSRERRRLFRSELRIEATNAS